MASSAAYTRTLQGMDISDLLWQAELVRSTTETPGWALVQTVIAEHEKHMLERLLNEATKPEEVIRLRGLLTGLASMREAAESIISFAVAAEEKANRTEESHV